MDTVSPELKYVTSSDVSNVSIRVYDVKDRKAFSFEERIDKNSLQVIRTGNATDSFIIPQGYLQEGKEYAWQVYVTVDVGTPLTYSALSDMHYFRVESQQTGRLVL